MNAYEESIILIGPMGVGKSSAAKEIARILHMHYMDIDNLRWEYFSKQSDYNAQIVDEFFRDSKEMEAFCYMKPFEARFTIDFLEKKHYGVFDFGAGYSVYEDMALFDEVKKSFQKYKHIIYLRYSDDAVESLEALRNRHEGISDDLYLFLNGSFIKSPCNEALATNIIETKNKTVQEVVAFVLANIRSK